jgi:hypothetical protein
MTKVLFIFCRGLFFLDKKRAIRSGLTKLSDSATFVYSMN